MACQRNGCAEPVLSGCEGLTVGSHEMLEQLDAASLILVPVGDERRWYCHHPLFADLMRKRLCRKQPHLIPALRREASDCYGKSGLISEAVSYGFAVTFGTAYGEPFLSPGSVPLHKLPGIGDPGRAQGDLPPYCMMC